MTITKIIYNENKKANKNFICNVDIVLDYNVMVHDISVYNGNKGPYLVFPNNKGSFVCFPTNEDMRTYILNTILEDMTNGSVNNGNE